MVQGSPAFTNSPTCRTRDTIDGATKNEAEAKLGEIKRSILLRTYHQEQNKEPAKILRANYLFRAVALPRGAHTVEFRFDPLSYRYGVAMSLAGLGVGGIWALGAVVVGRRRRWPAAWPYGAGRGDG